MRVLVVYCHPVPESFCAALRDRALAALAAAGHETRLVDLYAEGFDPVMGAEERRGYNVHEPSDVRLAPHIQALRWAQAMVFVYPTWWYGQPAMLKGWFERVWAKDVAFTLAAEGGRIEPLMGHIEKLAVLTTCGAPRWWSFLVGHPGRKILLRGIRALCARRCRTLHLAKYEMDAADEPARAAFLARVEHRLAAFFA
jgi:putative NADPH-quinone reductase